MEGKIVKKASDMFLKLGFKSVTMDDIAKEMCISKKTIYKYFCNKDLLIEETTRNVHDEIHSIMGNIISQNHNAIKENFEIRRMFKEMFQSTDTSPMYQLKKHYPMIYEKVIGTEIKECNQVFRQNIEKGIRDGLYRPELDVEDCVKFYRTLIFSINENTVSEREAQSLELKALEYHTRAIATPEGVAELEKHLQNIK